LKGSEKIWTLQYFGLRVKITSYFNIVKMVGEVTLPEHLQHARGLAKIFLSGKQICDG
jgi:hypothetical protein